MQAADSISESELYLFMRYTEHQSFPKHFRMISAILVWILFTYEYVYSTCVMRSWISLYTHVANSLLIYLHTFSIAYVSGNVEKYGSSRLMLNVKY